MADLRIDDAFASFDDWRVHYQSVGEGRRAVVFLSGWGCDVALWRRQVPALAAHARLILIDLPGHGRSDKPDVPYAIPFFVRAVDAVLRHAGVDKAAVAGHSMGAMVAHRYAAAWPQRTVALIWVDGAFGVPVEIESQMAGFREYAAKFRGPGAGEAIREFVQRLYAPETPAAVREEITNQILSTPRHVLASAQECFAVPETFEHPVLDLPAFALFSTFWQPARFLDVFRKYLPRLEYTMMEGVGHYPMLEKPEETNAVLAGFLKRLAPELR